LIEQLWGSKRVGRYQKQISEEEEGRPYRILQYILFTDLAYSKVLKPSWPLDDALPLLETIPLSFTSYYDDCK
jgi:hypothetical protein